MTGAEVGTGDGVIGVSIPFDSLSAGTGTGDGVICNAIPFDSLSARTGAGTGTEEPTPNPITNPIAIAPSGAPDLDPDPARAIRRFPCYNITSYKSSIRNLSLL